MHIELDVIEIMIIITWFIICKWAMRFLIVFMGVKMINEVKRKGEEKLQGFKQQFASKVDNEGDLED